MISYLFLPYIFFSYLNITHLNKVLNSPLCLYRNSYGTHRFYLWVLIVFKVLKLYFLEVRIREFLIFM